MYDTPLRADDVRTVLDLGGNVGISCLWWTRQYPEAQITTWEPHPTHCDLLETHMRSNGCAARIRLYRAAAGTTDGEVELTDDDDASTIRESFRATKGCICVPLVDVFRTAPSGRIDILKMDIEGAEYPILSDIRFEELASRTRFIVLEWHNRTSADLGEQWCIERLQNCGFFVQSDPTLLRGGGKFGLIRGLRLTATEVIT